MNTATDNSFSMLRELLEYDPSGDQLRMSDWETSFIDSVRLREDLSLSSRQSGKIAEIWHRIFG